jgi:hypothetical protein
MIHGGQGLNNNGGPDTHTNVRWIYTMKSTKGSKKSIGSINTLFPKTRSINQPKNLVNPLKIASIRPILPACPRKHGILADLIIF